MLSNRVLVVFTAVLIGAASLPDSARAGAAEQQTATRAKNRAAASTQMQEMEEALKEQTQAIRSLQQQLESRDQVIDQLQKRVDTLQDTFTATQQKVESNATQDEHVARALQNDVADLKTVTASTANAFQNSQKQIADFEHPTQLRFKGITITPGGFLEAAGIYRSHNENGDVGSTFGNIPFSGTANAGVSEFRGSARQSRISLLAEGQLGSAKLSGYYEMDFLGAAPTANELQSNSFNPRQRQLWAQAELDNGWSFVGGQTWGLLSTNRKGLAPRQEYLPLTIDSQYVVGFTWTRQWGARVTKKLNDRTWIAFALENPETSLSVTNPPPNVFGFNNSPNATSPGSLLTLNNTPGATGVSTDLAPDVIAKVVFEPGWGHYEVKAVGRFFRDRINGSNNYTAGGGFGVAAILPAQRKLDLIFQGLAGSGIGRYGAGAGSDVTLRPDGSIVPIRAFQALGGAEFHPAPKLDLYAYFGDEYWGRAAYIDSTGRGVGYGSSLNDNSGCQVEVSNSSPCQAQNRDLWQAQPGFWYRFYKGTSGTMQLGMSYSYTHRSTWVGTGVEPNGIENMVITSFRYYLP
jgi:hypothetical protein